MTSNKQNESNLGIKAFAPAIYSSEKEQNDRFKIDEEKYAGDTKSQESLPVKYPISVAFIVANEFCERFSFYGMKTILAIYLSSKLGLGDDTATVIYHSFNMFVYFFPIFGAMIADSWLGKFKTIFYLSIVYALGNITLSSGALPIFGIDAMRYFTLFGLLLIAIGTGGIKPCVAAFGGDQFVLPQQERQLVQFFSVFYFAINAGSLISTFLTPIFREDIHCFGEDDCFPLAFGVPGVLMIVSLILFLIGHSMYKIKEPTGNTVLLVCKCIGHAISRKCELKNSERKDHWLDYADDKFDQKFIDGVKAVLRVILLYLPLPVFWALFDQQGSRWTFQANHMSGEMGGFDMKPDQMQVINPLLILILVPLFDTFIYPIFGKCNLIQRPLQKMVVGGFLAALAFIISGLVELQLEKTYVKLPDNSHSELRIYNGFDCSMNLKLSNPQLDNITVQSFQFFEHKYELIDGKKTQIHFNIENKCGGEEINKKIDLMPAKQMSFFYGSKFEEFKDSTDKTETGNPKVRVLINIDTFTTVEIKEGKIVRFETNSTVAAKTKGNLAPGTYEVYVNDIKVDDIRVKLGGVYVIFITLNSKGNYGLELTEVTPPNDMSMLWLLPQYFVITMGEVMFSVTGLEFSYSQAPASMKSVLQACWLLTTAIGNAIVIIIAEARISNSQAVEFFFFAGLMILTMFIFIFLAIRYTYVEPETSEDNDSELELQKKLSITGCDNFAFKTDPHLE